MQSRKENLQSIRNPKNAYLLIQYHSIAECGFRTAELKIITFHVLHIIRLRIVELQRITNDKQPLLNPYHFILESRIGLYPLTNLHNGHGKDLLPSQAYNHVLDVRFVVNIIKCRTKFLGKGPLRTVGYSPVKDNNGLISPYDLLQGMFGKGTKNAQFD